MGRGRLKKRKNPPEDNIDESEPKSSKQQERVRGTAARSTIINYKLFVDSESSEEEDPNVCPLCEDQNDPSGKKNRMIGCDGCDRWYHWSCVQITQKNKPGKKDDWFCLDCRRKQNGEVNHAVKTLAQKKCFVLADKNLKNKDSWITSSKKGILNNSAEKRDRKEVESVLDSFNENKDADSSDESNSHQASSSSQISSKPGSDSITSGTEDLKFQDFLFENPLVISDEPEVKLKIQLLKKTDFKGEICGPVKPLKKPDEESDSWKPVVDPSGARGLKLVPSPEKKESSSSVIKDIDGHSVTDGSDSNQHSSSRLSGCGEGEVRESRDKGMDFPNVLDELFNSDLPTNTIKTQQDEAKIQSITKNLEATGASILQQSQHNFAHPLPNILTHSRNDAMDSSSTQSVATTLSSASNTTSTPNQYSVSVDQSRLLHQEKLQNDMISKGMDKAGLKILSPLRLNEKHVNVSGTNNMETTDLSRVLMQSGLAQATGGPAICAKNGVQPNSIFLNQNKPIVSPVASLPGPVTSIALAPVSLPLSGLPVSGVVLSHPAQVRPGLPSVDTNQLRPGPQIRLGISLASNMITPGVNLASPQICPGSVSPQVQVRPGSVVSSSLAPGSSSTVRPPQPGVRIVRPVRGGPVRMRGRGETRPRMGRPPAAGGSGTPPGVRGSRPRGPSPRGRVLRGASRGQPRLVRPLQPGTTRQLRPGTPRGPRPPMSGTPRGPRPAQPSAPGPVRPSVPSPAVAVTVKPEVIDLSDDEEAPPYAKSATLDKLRACGISVSKQKAPPLPTNVRLPPGISLSGSADSGPKRCSVSSNRDSANKKVALDHNVASAITAVGNTSNEPKQKVELELSDKQMNALRALGLL